MIDWVWIFSCTMMYSELYASTSTSPARSRSAGRGRPLRLSSAMQDSAPDASFNTLTMTGSNIRAVEAALNFARGAERLVCLIGPSGWGKTHLLRATADLMAREFDREWTYCGALEWLEEDRRPETPAPLILDDAQLPTMDFRNRHRWFLRLNRRVTLGRPTLIGATSSSAKRWTRTYLPRAREWTIAAIREPDVEERRLIVGRMAESFGLRLSLEAVNLIALHLVGNGNSIRGFFTRLSCESVDWEKRTNVLRLCGLLSPYALGYEGWDPRDRIFDAVKVLARHRGDDEAVTHQMACFLMLEIAKMSEGEVAAFFQSSPGHVYDQAEKLRLRLEDGLERERAVAYQAFAVDALCRRDA